MSVAVGLSVRVVHRRPARSLLGPLARLWPQFRAVSAKLILLGAVVLILPPWDMGGDFVPNLDLGSWLFLFPLSLAAVRRLWSRGRRA